MTHSALANGMQLTSDSSARPSRIDRFIVHHAATTSLAAILSLFQPGGRTVSANYALGSDGTLVLAVDEDRRAWTSASAAWDGRAVTIEVANSIAGGSWPVSDAAFEKLAALIADVARRYGFPINDTTVLTHQELYQRYGASYATACPGDLQRRKGELLARANQIQATGTAGLGSTPIDNAQKGKKMYLAWDTGGTGWLTNDNGWFGLPSMQIYALFSRVINSNQAAPRPETFLRTEVDMMSAVQVAMVRSGNGPYPALPTFDTAKLADAISTALGAKGITTKLASDDPELVKALDAGFVRSTAAWANAAASATAEKIGFDPVKLAAAVAESLQHSGIVVTPDTQAVQDAVLAAMNRATAAIGKSLAGV